MTACIMHQVEGEKHSTVISIQSGKGMLGKFDHENY